MGPRPGLVRGGEALRGRVWVWLGQHLLNKQLGPRTPKEERVLGLALPSQFFWLSLLILLSQTLQSWQGLG